MTIIPLIINLILTNHFIILSKHLMTLTHLNNIYLTKKYS